MCAPLVCQSIIARGFAWNHFYFGSLVLSGISSALAFYAFRPVSRELEGEMVALLADTPRSDKVQRCVNVIPPSSADEANVAEVNKTLLRRHQARGKFWFIMLSDGSNAPTTFAALGRAFRLPIVWAFSIFSGLYTGSYVELLVIPPLSVDIFST